MREYLPILIVGAIVGVLSVIFLIAYVTMKDKKEAIGFDRNMKDGEIIRRLSKYALRQWPSFLLVYGCSYNKTIHVGLVYDVEELGDGKFRITTLEGNMSKRVKMYIHDYDMNAEVITKNKESTNLTLVPEAERILAESDHLDYAIPASKPSDSASGKYAYYVNCFLMPWIPDNMANTENTPEVSE